MRIPAKLTRELGEKFVSKMTNAVQADDAGKEDIGDNTFYAWWD